MLILTIFSQIFKILQFLELSHEKVPAPTKYRATQVTKINLLGHRHLLATIDIAFVH
jgi:hypothetical protein